MLILLLLAKGWAVTRQQITRSGWLLLMAIWIPYCAFHVVLYVWNRVSHIDPFDFEPFQPLSSSYYNYRPRWMLYRILMNTKHGPGGWCWHQGIVKFKSGDHVHDS